MLFGAFIHFFASVLLLCSHFAQKEPAGWQALFIRRTGLAPAAPVPATAHRYARSCMCAQIVVQYLLDKLEFDEVSQWLEKQQIVIIVF